MDNRFTRQLYDSAPISLRSVFASAYGLKKRSRRFGGEFDRWCEFFDKGRHLTKEELNAIHEDRLTRHLSHAIQHVPYYRRISAQIDTAAIEKDPIHALKTFPYLTKQDISSVGFEALLSEQADISSIEWKPTSGSTGKPMRFPWPARIEQMEFAFIWTRCRLGISLDDPYSSFTGLEILPPQRSKPPFWIHNWPAHQRVFSIFHMNDSNMRAYAEALASGYNRYLSGYSSAVAILADYFIRNEIRLSQAPVAFFNGSEQLTPRNRELISSAFGCQVVDHYGQVELCASITQYECGHLHCDTDYSYIELDPVSIDEEGLTIAEIVATNFHNPDYPLVRYRTGDLVAYDPEKTSVCSHPGTVVERIHGRTGQYFILPDGRKVTNISVIAKKCKNIQSLQVLQREETAIDVVIVPEQSFSSSDEELLRSEFKKKIGTSIQLNIQKQVAPIRTASGKSLSIINEIKKQ